MAKSSVTVEHEFQCRIDKDPGATQVFHAIHHISMKEANAVFELQRDRLSSKHCVEYKGGDDGVVRECLGGEGQSISGRRVR